MLIEAGAIGQLLEQRAALAGVGACGIGDIDADAVADALLLDPREELLYSLLIGLPADGARP